MPSMDEGGTTCRKLARNWRPCSRCCCHCPLAWMCSPACTSAADPRTVTRSRCPRILTRSTQNPVSALWNVTRSTTPDSGSRPWSTTPLSAICTSPCRQGLTSEDEEQSVMRLAYKANHVIRAKRLSLFAHRRRRRSRTKTSGQCRVDMRAGATQPPSTEAAIGLLMASDAETIAGHVCLNGYCVSGSDFDLFGDFE